MARKPTRGNQINKTNFNPPQPGLAQIEMIEELNFVLSNVFLEYQGKIPEGRYASKFFSALDDARIFGERAIIHDYVKPVVVVQKS